MNGLEGIRSINASRSIEFKRKLAINERVKRVKESQARAKKYRGTTDED